MLYYYVILLQNVLVSQNFGAQRMEAQSVGGGGAKYEAQSLGCKEWGAKCGGRKVWGAKCGAQSMGVQWVKPLSSYENLSFNLLFAKM